MSITHVPEFAVAEAMNGQEVSDVAVVGSCFGEQNGKLKIGSSCDWKKGGDFLPRARKPQVRLLLTQCQPNP